MSVNASAYFGLGHGIFIARKRGIATTAFDPSQITGLTSWYKADSGVTNTGNGTDATAWTDLSATGNNLSIHDGHPKYYSSAQNGLPGVNFDGASVMSAGNLADVSQPYTEFFVFRPTGWVSAGAQVLCGMSSSSPEFGKNNGDTRLYMYSGNTLFGPTLSNNGNYIATAFYNGSASSMTVNGSAASTGDAGTRVNTNSTFLGGPGTGVNYWAGYAFEWIFYQGALSPADTVKVQNYLNAKWAIY
jgi:hypothetical protein